jgi:hypothetical protein
MADLVPNYFLLLHRFIAIIIIIIIIIITISIMKFHISVVLFFIIFATFVVGLNTEFARK